MIYRYPGRLEQIPLIAVGVDAVLDLQTSPVSVETKRASRCGSAVIVSFTDVGFCRFWEAFNELPKNARNLKAHVSEELLRAIGCRAKFGDAKRPQ